MDEPASYMQMIYVDSANCARHTNVRAACGANAQTWAAFNSYRRLGVPVETATFLLDYHNAKGDLSDTIGLDAAGFQAVTGQKAKSEAEYRAIDAEYWREARKEAAVIEGAGR